MNFSTVVEIQAEPVNYCLLRTFFLTFIITGVDFDSIPMFFFSFTILFEQPIVS